MQKLHSIHSLLYRDAFKLEPDNFTTSFQLSAIYSYSSRDSVNCSYSSLVEGRLNMYARGGFSSSC